MKSIPYMIYRGGTSKGPFFLKKDLPKNRITRDRVINKIMGSPHPYQVDGIGGGVPNASKIGIVSISSREDSDIEYAMGQIDINGSSIDMSGDCGNMLSAVGYFALELNLVKSTDPYTIIRVYSPNTKSIKEVTVPTKKHKPIYQGNYSIDGVSGSGAQLKVSFLNPGGSQTKKIFPTGNRIDIINGIQVTIIDCGRALVILKVDSLNITGYEKTKILEENLVLNQTLEEIRVKSSLLMGIKYHSKTYPRIAILCQSQSGDAVHGRYWISPKDCRLHPAMSMTAAMAISSCICLPGTVYSNFDMLLTKENTERYVSIGHAMGRAEIILKGRDNPLEIRSCSFKRTARLIAKGDAYI